MMNSNRVLLILLTVALAGLAACGDDGGSDGENTKPRPDVPDTNNEPNTPTWTLETVRSDGAGHNPTLGVSPTGDPVIAYFGQSYEDGLCEELMNDEPPQRNMWPIVFAEQNGDGTWSEEEVAIFPFVGDPRDMVMSFDPNSGAPTIVTMIGEPVPEILYCGANDLGLMQRNGPGDWSDERVVVNSADAASGESGSDFGFVVGAHASLAWDNNGQPAMAYKDIHAGGLQSIDFKRADLEFAWRQGGGWTRSVIDLGAGAGNHTTTLFDSQNRPYVVYLNPQEGEAEETLGIWAARSLDNGTTWERVRLYNQNTSRGLTAVLIEDRLHVIFYNARGYPELAIAGEDDSLFASLADGWEIESMGDNRYDEGYDASAAIGPNGELAVAYYRCTKAQLTIGDCNVNDDGLIFGWRDGSFWEYEEVDSGEDGLCGQRPTLRFDGDGRAHISYVCKVLEDGRLKTEVRYAVRKSL